MSDEFPSSQEQDKPSQEYKRLHPAVKRLRDASSSFENAAFSPLPYPIQTLPGSNPLMYQGYAHMASTDPMNMSWGSNQSIVDPRSMSPMPSSIIGHANTSSFSYFQGSLNSSPANSQFPSELRQSSNFSVASGQSRSSSQLGSMGLPFASMNSSEAKPNFKSLAKHEHVKKARTEQQNLKIVKEISVLRQQIAKTSELIARYEMVPQSLDYFVYSKEWSNCDPDFLQSGDGAVDSVGSDVKDKLKQSWKNNISSRDEMLQKHQEADMKSEPSLKHSRNILGQLGVTDLIPKVKLYAHLTMHKSVIKLINKEFMRLMRGKEEDFLGRSIRDFVPPAFDQWVFYMFHRELLASGSNSIIFNTVLSRLDGTLFKCLFGFSLFRSDDNVMYQTICTIHLNTVQDIDLPSLERPLRHCKSPMSFELDYPNSPETKKHKPST